MWNYPLAAITPQLNILSQTFSNLIGLTFGLYPSIPQSTTQSFFDQYFNPLILHDFDCAITLAIREADAK